MPIKLRDLEKMVKDAGWTLDHATGSHYIYIHAIKSGTVTIPFHGRNSDIGDVLFKLVKRQAGI